MAGRLLLILLTAASSVLAQLSIGSTCVTSMQCGKGAFCFTNVCRKDGCTISSQCQSGETCQYGKVNGKTRPACFPSKETRNIESFCPGGGAVVTDFDGRLATCDMSKMCREGQICNPQKGICCTKLRTCPKPAKVMLNSLNGRPIMCQYKYGTQSICPTSGYCEAKTGFCCQRGERSGPPPAPSVVLPPSLPDKPFVGQKCNTLDGCGGGATCNCETFGGCKCECPSELGYSISADGKSCQRLRRRLKEKCKTDMECSAAFSECATGGCRCKKGFQRDGDGGCKPINYKCPGLGSAMMKGDKPVVCHRRAIFSRLKLNITETEFEEIMSGNSTLEDWHDGRNEKDSCPEEYYCVAVFDDAAKPGFYQGFCCPSPSELRPVCPVGEAHESSSYPDYGCNECPNDYYCHRDGIITEKSICCPKPCTSLDDIYYDGQCYSTAYYGDSCMISAQCTAKPSFGVDDSELAPLECRRSVCQCPSGYSHSNGQCRRVMCTVGLRGEPSVDKNNDLLVCQRSSDCSQGQLCDITHNVCCKGMNRCPSGLEETGEYCSSSDCTNPAHICHTASEYKKTKICCAEV